MKNPIYTSFTEAKQKNKKCLAVLIDPDKMRLSNINRVIENAVYAKVDYFFVGGSLILDDRMDFCLDALNSQSTIPTILFPSSPQQINKKADGILFLSLISGRNPDLLIGQHVLAAPILKNTKLEVISTGYMLIDGGAATTASYISSTIPIPNHKDEIAYCTAIAGEMLGLKTIYMDAGSGARQPVSQSMIKTVSKAIPCSVAQAFTRYNGPNPCPRSCDRRRHLPSIAICRAGLSSWSFSREPASPSDVNHATKHC